MRRLWPRLLFFACLAVALSAEGAAIFLPMSAIRAAGERPYVIEDLAAGERVGQTFRILDDGLESVDIELSSTGPASTDIMCRLLGSPNDAPNDGFGRWAAIYEWKTTLQLPRGRSWHHFAFRPIFPSRQQVYQFQVEQLDVRALDPKRPGRPHVGVMASKDDFLKEGNIIVGKEQIIGHDLLFAAHTADELTSFRREANPHLPRLLRYLSVQLGLLALYNASLAAFAYCLTIVAPERDSSARTVGPAPPAFRSYGVKGVLAAVGRRVRPRRLQCYKAIEDAFRGKTGLEIGGPSDLFTRRGLLPAYAIARSIDNCNFSHTTVWEGTIQEGLTFTYDARHAPGRQYIHEAMDLRSIPDGQYDFVLASHTIEHVANPLRALREWIRVMKDGALLVLVVPHKDGTFDHRRSVTQLAHLVEDDRNGTTEDDLTHLPEILALHDLALDPPAGDADAFRARSARNLENRCLHHHVFDTNLVVEMTHHVGLQILAVEPMRPYHIFLIARKLPAQQPPDNDRFLVPNSEYRARNLFDTDRVRHA